MTQDLRYAKPELWGRVGDNQFRDVPVCNWVVKSRERQLSDLDRWLSDDPTFPYYFDEREADRKVEFFSQLCHFDGEWYGEPFTLSDWQEWDIVRPLFGWKRKSNGFRRFRLAYILIPRRNGKSFLASAMAGALWIADREFGAQVYTAATKEEQAKIVWSGTERAMKLNPELYNEVQFTKRSGWNDFLGAVYKPLGRDSKSTDGLSVHGAVVDEYHAHADASLFNVIKSGMGSRRQPLLIIISTAGTNIDGPCKREDEHCEKVLDGVVSDDTYFCYKTTIDNPEDPNAWQDPENWWKANPNMGISVYVEGFEDDFKKAKDRPHLKSEFLCKKLNIWQNAYTKWINMDEYTRCMEHPIDLDFLKHRRCFAGLDLGQNRDLSALMLAFLGDEEITVDEEGKMHLPNLYTLGFYFIPSEGRILQSKEERLRYPEWVEKGYMIETPGKTTNYAAIRAKFRELSEIYDIHEIAADYAHAGETMQKLSDEGYNCVKAYQGFNFMHLGCESLEAAIIDTRFRPGDDPVLRWCFSNAVIAKNHEEKMRIIKEKSDDRVDPCVALAMAVKRILVSPEPVKSVYRQRGLRSI